MSANNNTKLVLVIGATGAQGMAVIDRLLEPGANGSPSPYSVRALTRDPDSRRANELKARGVECVKGAFDDFESVRAALRGVYGVWANTDGFTVGEEKEVWSGIRIFEIAKELGTVKHYIWSSLEYLPRITGYNPVYKCGHYDGKGRVADWMKAQDSNVNEDGSGMVWSVVTSGPYMDMLTGVMFGPLKEREDGTAVFVTPIGNGHAPMIALSDLGFFARYVFDNRDATSGKDLQVASDMVGWEYLRTTFEKVTGRKAEVIYQPLDVWFDNFSGTDLPVANERPAGDGSTTWKENFSGWWALFRDDILKRDMNWIRRVNPHGHTLESWMREKRYTGRVQAGSESLLKNSEDGKSIVPRWDVIAAL